MGQRVNITSDNLTFNLSQSKPENDWCAIPMKPEIFVDPNVKGLTSEKKYYDLNK